MTIWVQRENNKWWVQIPELNIKASFAEVDDATVFIQSVITNIKSY